MVDKHRVNKYFIIYTILIAVLLILLSYNTFREALSGKGYLYISSTESPVYLFTMISFLLRLLGIPLVSEIVLYYYFLTLISAITVYLFLLKIIKLFKPEATAQQVSLSAIFGGIFYVFYPRMFLVDVGPSFLMFKAILPLLLLLGIDMAIADNTMKVIRCSFTYSALLALGYLITYDPRLIIHSIFLTAILIISILFAFKSKIKNILFRIIMLPTLILVLTVLFSFPRVYNDIFLRTLPIGSGIAYVHDAFLYTWSTYLTAFTATMVFLYPFYKLKLGFLWILLTLPSLVIASLFLWVAIKLRRDRAMYRFIVVLMTFFVILIALFCSSSFSAKPLFVNLAFNDVMLKIIDKYRVFKYFILLFRAPRFIDDFLHIFFSISTALLSILIILSQRKKELSKKIINVAIPVTLVIIIVATWVAPIAGNALIFNIKAIEEAKYYDEFLRSVNGNSSTSLYVMFYHGSRPGGYLVKYIYPTRPYWRADGTIANFVYEYLREKIYSKDLFAVHAIVCLYGFRYFVINTINGYDRAIDILNSSSYFSFYKRIGPLYVFEVKDCSRKNDVILTNHVLVVGGLETYIELIRYIKSKVNNSEISVVPILDDSWGYDIDYVLKSTKAIVFMSQKDMLDLLFSYLLLNEKYTALLIPSEHTFSYDPLHKWSPAYSTYAFHGIFPYFDWFPAPYTWEYGYNPHYGFVWTKANGANITIKFYIDKNDRYTILIRHLMTPDNSKILIRIDNVTYTLLTQDKSSEHSYLKATKLDPIYLKEGWHSIDIINLDGFNMINVILIIPQNEFSYYYNYLKDLIKNKLIITLNIDNHNIDINCTNCTGIDFIHNLIEDSQEIGYVKCNRSGMFYRLYVCEFVCNQSTIEGQLRLPGRVIVTPELYGLVIARNKTIVSLPVMYVLQGFGNISYGSFTISDIRNEVSLYEWIAFFVNIVILTYPLWTYILILYKKYIIKLLIY